MPLLGTLAATWVDVLRKIMMADRLYNLLTHKQPDFSSSFYKLPMTQVHE